ncbi:MAG TPA: efflux RND transporter periplasmic adaptor subunit [Candidatus Hydrogenedens sp.]|nr:efflux RND transporter periplasmic adaptor subunit [Candidatus Hydrogenedens sp.]
MAKTKCKIYVIRIFLILVLLSLIFVPLYYFLFYTPPIQVTVDTVKRGKVQQTVSAFASGTVTSTRRSMIAGGTLGTVSIVHVKEGQRVSKNDILLELNHEDLDAQVALSEANLLVAETRLEQARVSYEVAKELSESRLKQTQAQLKQAEADYERANKLREQGILSPGEQEKIELAYRVAQEGYQSALVGVKEIKVREQEVKAGETAVAQAKASLLAAQATRDKAIIRAPFDGVVATINIHEGEGVAMGLPLMYLIDDKDLYVEAPFDEANAGQVSLNQKARIELDAFPGKVFQGEIIEISPTITISKEFTRTFTVKVRFLEQENFMPGMSADVTIIVSEKDDVLYVPSESLIRDEYAFVLEQGKAIRRPVTIGIGNWETREIIKGLKEGETIITSVGIKGLVDGSRVDVVSSLGE